MKLVPVCNRSSAERILFDKLRSHFKLYCGLRRDRGDCVSSRVAADTVVFYSSMVGVK